LRKRADEVLELVELGSDGGKKVANYSGGMKKRLSLAVALLHSPKLLILDEPTVGIDPILRQKIWREFYELKKQDKTIIVTTHVMDEAVKCDRLGLIYGGGIIACDTVDVLLHRTKNNSIEELFLENGGQAK
jgi:ABC-2 type transport system ATP-binding protein